MPNEVDGELRATLGRWVEAQRALHGDVLDAATLRQGFSFRGACLPLIVQQGILKPKVLDCALTLRTSFDSPYADHFEDPDTLVYSYQGQNPQNWDNLSVRNAMEAQVPLLYLHGVSEKPVRYSLVWPVYVVDDDPIGRVFRVRAEPGVALGDVGSPTSSFMGQDELVLDIRRRYGTCLVRRRLHQERFRERVLAAYGQQCAMCRLRHRNLLDAAHIVADAEDAGEPLVTNGLALCKIHHAAFDAKYLSVNPDDCRIHVKPSLLDEEDGPMLLHGLQELHRVRLQLPRRPVERPDPERLRQHWTLFLTAS